MYVIQLQREGQIPIKLNFAQIGSETVKTVETKKLSLGAKKIELSNFSKPMGPTIQVIILKENKGTLK